jgi:hypothetical protein
MNTPYKTRDEEWAKYAETNDLRNRYGSLVLAALHDAWDAGWEGRKRAEYVSAIPRRSEPCPAPAPQERPS